MHTLANVEEAAAPAVWPPEHGGRLREGLGNLETAPGAPTRPAGPVGSADYMRIIPWCIVIMRRIRPM